MHASEGGLRRQRVVGGELDPPRPNLVIETAWNDRRVGLGLVLEDPQLGAPVSLERAVPVEMVRLEVEQHCDPRPKLVYVLELKRGQLDDDELLRLDLAVELGERPADVSGHRRAQHEAKPLRRRRLPVRAGDSEDRVRQQPGRELDLAPDGDALLARRGDDRRLARNARTLDDHTDSLEQRKIEVVAKFAVGADDLHPAPLERRGGSDPGARQPEHEHAFGQPAQRNPRK